MDIKYIINYEYLVLLPLVEFKKMGIDMCITVEEIRKYKFLIADVFSKRLERIQIKSSKEDRMKFIKEFASYINYDCLIDDDKTTFSLKDNVSIYELSSMFYHSLSSSVLEVLTDENVLNEAFVVKGKTLVKK